MEKKKVTEMVCLLDKSGSMFGKEKDTIGSYNRMLKKQKAEEGEAYITMALFSDRCEVLYSHTPIEKAEFLTEKDYYTEGNTALFDAIGKVFAQVEAVSDNEKEQKVLVFIITDGMENASVHFTQSKIRDLIEEKQKKGWVILFFGTDMEIIHLAEDTGIKKENTFRYENTSRGFEASMAFAGSRFSEMRAEERTEKQICKNGIYNKIINKITGK